MAEAMNQSTTAPPQLQTEHQSNPNRPAAEPNRIQRGQIMPVAQLHHIHLRRMAFQLLKLAMTPSEQLRAEGYLDFHIQIAERVRPIFGAMWRRFLPQAIRMQQQQQQAAVEQPQPQLQQQGPPMVDPSTVASIWISDRLARVLRRSPLLLYQSHANPKVCYLARLVAKSNQSTESPAQQTQSSQLNMQQQSLGEQAPVNNSTQGASASSSIGQVEQEEKEQGTTSIQRVLVLLLGFTEHQLGRNQTGVGVSVPSNEC